MAYKRMFRWARYKAPKCKEYLRNDFLHECAYCHLKEIEVPFIGAKYFQIDHFRPQSGKDLTFDVDDYSNLYYSCENCNEAKSDIWNEDLLDPCVDDVFSGENPFVLDGYDPTNNYKYNYTNDRGLCYINTFQLNSKYHLRSRKHRAEDEKQQREKEALKLEIMAKVKGMGESDNFDELIALCDRLCCAQEKGTWAKDEQFENVENYLLKNAVTYSVEMAEYNIDFKINLSGKTYCCELLVDRKKEDDDTKCKRIEVEKIKTWAENLTEEFGVMVYYPLLGKLYFYPISELTNLQQLTEKRKEIVLTEDFLLERQV